MYGKKFIQEFLREIIYIYIYIEEKSAVGQELDFGLVSIRVEKRRGKNIEKALPS